MFIVVLLFLFSDVFNTCRLYLQIWSPQIFDCTSNSCRLHQSTATMSLFQSPQIVSPCLSPGFIAAFSGRDDRSVPSPSYLELKLGYHYV